MKDTTFFSLIVAAALTASAHADPIRIVSTQNDDGSMYGVNAVIDLDPANGVALGSETLPAPDTNQMLTLVSYRFDGAPYSYTIEGVFGSVSDNAVIVTAVDNLTRQTFKALFDRMGFDFQSGVDVLEVRPAGTAGDDGAASVFLVGDPDWFGANGLPLTLEAAGFGSFTDNGAPFFMFTTDDLPNNPRLDTWRNIQITSLGDDGAQTAQVPLGGAALALLALGLGLAGVRRLA